MTVKTEGWCTVECDNAVGATNISLQKLSVVVEPDYNRTNAIAICIPKRSVEDCFNYDRASEDKYIRLTLCDDKDD